MTAVFGLGESVSIEEYRCLWFDNNFLNSKLPVGHHANRDIRVTGQLSDTSTYEQRNIVTSIALVQGSCGEVKHANKERDKHIRITESDNDIVQVFHDAAGH